MDPKVILAAMPEVLTQLIAFLIVFFILKKYAFGTIFKVLEQRQKTISSLIQDAERKKNELESLKKEYELKLQGIEQEGRAKVQLLLSESQKAASEIRERAHADAAIQLERAKKDIQHETEKARAVIRQQVVELSTQMAAKLIQKNLTGPENEKYVLELLSHTGDVS